MRYLVNRCALNRTRDAITCIADDYIDMIGEGEYLSNGILYALLIAYIAVNMRDVCG